MSFKDNFSFISSAHWRKRVNTRVGLEPPGFCMRRGGNSVKMSETGRKITSNIVTNKRLLFQINSNIVTKCVSFDLNLFLLKLK